MKKLIAMLLALVMVLGLAACGGNAAPAETKAAPAETKAPATEAAADNTAAEGRVYYLNFKPEADATMQELAALYTETTGVPVKVVTAASGTYSDTLTAEMAKTEAPTIFNIGNLSGLNDWDKYALNLADTAVAGELTTDEFNLYNDAGELKAIGNCFESYGIIVNKALLEKAGHSVEEITDFASLKAVADDIHTRAAELGFDAFSAPGLDGSSSWRFSGHLANMPLFYEFRDDNVTEQPATIKGTYMDNFRNIWDLYVTDTAADPKTLTTGTADESKAQFTEGKAAFYQNGTWEYSNLVTDESKGFNMNPDDLAMIPIYCGVAGEEKAGLCCGTENCWSVNKNAKPEDIQATLDFMKWVVTSDAGTTLMAEQFGPCPFKSAKTPENIFFADANNYIAEGNYVVTWAFNYTPAVDDWRAGVVDALSQYTAGGADWSGVETAFVQGWAQQYAAENAG